MQITHVDCSFCGLRPQLLARHVCLLRLSPEVETTCKRSVKPAISAVSCTNIEIFGGDMGCSVTRISEVLAIFRERTIKSLSFHTSCYMTKAYVKAKHCTLFKLVAVAQLLHLI